MTQVDFIVALFITVAVIMFSLFIVLGRFNTDFDQLNLKSLDIDSATLLQQINDNLTENFRSVQVMFNETSGLSHSETLQIILRPSGSVDRMHVYDNLLNEIPSAVVKDLTEVRVDITLSFSANEKKLIRFIYSGTPTTEIIYGSNPVTTNVSAIILSERVTPVISDAKCSDLSETFYQSLRNSLGAENNFHVTLTDCNFGPLPPLTNVVVKSKTVMKEKSDGVLSAEVMRLSVW